MTRWRITVLVLMTTGTVFLAWRHHSLQELRSEQERLLAQMHEVRDTGVAKENWKPAGNSTNALSPAEHLEVLRLRGQISALQEELRQTTNVSRRPSPSGQPTTAEDGDTTAFQTTTQRKMADGRQWIIALMIYAQSNEGRLPSTLAEAGSYAGAAATNDGFELMTQGKLVSGPGSTAPRTPVLRERTPWQGANGKWNRTYVFMDGHVEVARSERPDFTRWEEELKDRDNN